LWLIDSAPIIVLVVLWWRHIATFSTAWSVRLKMIILQVIQSVI